MDLRYIRMFKNKDSSCPETVIRMKEVDKVPQILSGSVSCISFHSSEKESHDEADKIEHHNLSVCMKDYEEAKKVLAAFQNFQICRLGGSLESYDKLKVEEIVKATCNSIPKKHREDERDSLNREAKDKTGKLIPKVDVSAIKTFLRKELGNNGFIVKDQLKGDKAGFKGKADKEKKKVRNGKGGKEVFSVPGFPIPEVLIEGR
eukprot:CAMPEP_0170520604 /NCGR_PEP_ID=MMETSP0209-20121228/5922_1 /TAXON_ID=665100 ORGANISM="Litonotus pictus, Strain P1" /NCGR_SAMPLE_ID=MMETSP0209 /ASSEMBLY_ACC=CAM_ASM_000301 /LENGTH=203 /DNA_ID=CAMNT_0010807025 /DNA_START=249 /DNA_END=856 /DNA_ORIENTATION=+